MNIDVEVTPSLIEEIDQTLLCNTSKVSSTLVVPLVVRARFCQWLNKLEASHKLSQICCSTYEIAFCNLAHFEYIAHYSEELSAFNEKPINPQTLADEGSGVAEGLQVRYFVTIAFTKLFWDCDAYAATVPFHEVDMLVFVPKRHHNTKFCTVGEFDNGRLVMPMLFERTLKINPIPWSNICKTDVGWTFQRSSENPDRRVMQRSLANNIQLYKKYLPTIYESSPIQMQQMSSAIAKQWMYWMYDIGAEHTRCNNYGLLALIFGHETVSKITSHRGLIGLMFLVVMMPECFALPELFFFTCTALKTAPFIELRDCVRQGGNLFSGGTVDMLNRVAYLSNTLLNHVSFESPAEKFDRMRNDLIHSLPDETSDTMRQMGFLRLTVFGFVPKQLLEEGINMRDFQKQTRHVYATMGNAYRRVHTRTILAPAPTAIKMFTNRVVERPIIEHESDEPKAGKEYICSDAAQVDRMRFTRAIYKFCKLYYIQVMHYQLQLQSTQSCVYEHGRPRCIICPNEALAEQARMQWGEPLTFTVHQYAENVSNGDVDQLQAILFPSGFTADSTMFVLLHAEMYGIEQWLEFLDITLDAVTSILDTQTDARIRDLLEDYKMTIMVVCDVFMSRPMVIRHKFPYGSVYGTESVCKQISYCEEAITKRIILIEPDEGIDPKNVPFLACKLYHELSTGRQRYKKESTVRRKMQQFLKTLVERMWLGTGEKEQSRKLALDSMRLPKIYVHTGFSDLTDRMHLQSKTFKRDDYIMFGDTGEMLSLWVHRVEGNKTDGKVPRATLKRKLRNDCTKTFLCDCVRPLLDNKCDAITVDQESPWCLHQEHLLEFEARNGAGSGEYNLKLPVALETAKIGRPLVRLRSSCSHVPQVGNPASRPLPRVTCFHPIAAGQTRESVHGFATHEVMSCTRDYPVRSTSYVGPSAAVVYINLSAKTSAGSFLHACSLAREHIQVVYSEQAKKIDEVTGADGRVQMSRGSNNYVMQLRCSKPLGQALYDLAVDSIIQHMITCIENKIYHYPTDGLWFVEMYQRTKAES